MPRRENNPKEHRELIEDHDIYFDGPIPPSSWPVHYSKIFQNIRDIERLRFDEYGSNEKRGILPVAEMKKRVSKLNGIAYKCRKQRENEATWRGHTEPEVISRFDAEVLCSICRKRLWRSEFQALPGDPIEAEVLRQRRAKRTLCSCSPTARAEEDRNERAETLLFANRIEGAVLHDPEEKLAERGVRTQFPDRVYGLSQPELLRTHIRSRRCLRHSPFEDGNILYPFLIIEAKSEKGSPGFESIESQTAFPIRTLLKLQESLSSVSDVTLSPLVWFMANQGDEWRLYASITDGPKFRVIDLWHGTILSQDCALQLLLIIDYICDWARDIYRPNVVRCLAGGDADMGDSIPDDTETSSQVNEAKYLQSSSSHSSPRPSTPETPTLIDLSPEDEGDDTEMSDFQLLERDDEAIQSTNVNNDQPLLRFSISHNAPDHWSRHATIRHSNLVSFEFRHFAIPEDPKELHAYLNSLGMEGGMSHKAKCLLEILEEESAVTIPMNGIHQLENLWTRSGPPLIPENEYPIRARVMFHTTLRSEDWQLMKELSCFTSSQRAAMQLMKIAGKDCSSPTIDWNLHCCPCLIADAQSLRSLSGTKSVSCAANNLGLRLSFKGETTEVHMRWVKAPYTEEIEARFRGLWTVLDPSCSDDKNIVGFHSSNLLEEVSTNNSGCSPSLAPLLPILWRSFRHGGVILKKPSSWPESCPTFCFMVVDDTRFDHEPGLGDKIIRACNSGYFYDGKFIANGAGFPSRSDTSAIELWTDILMGFKESDAQWPL